ncbi:MAG TPA: hypothetical protein VFK96_08495 [Gammaproteobacteria bacterium]|nr:hypothetical protein [Gammaproteobacteria bacterium]
MKNIKLLLAATLFFAATASAATVPTNAYNDMQWRLVGPFRAGWATAVTGVPGSPNVWLFGGADGGVWKTTDDGVTWKSIFDTAGGSSVGALAVAPSDPNVIYMGSGQVATRYDIAAGNGVYKSTDGGKTWHNVGLKDTRHIGRILIDPKNSDVVLVAALGHVFGPSTRRGVFRTDDGGKTWHRTLYVGKQTGAVDLAFDPTHPAVVYAAVWQMRMKPWLDYFEAPIGPKSGVYKSTDEGRTWHRVDNGLPDSPMGRIGLGVARGSDGRIVYAIVQAQDDAGVYRSTDGGAHWHNVNHNGGLADSYFGRLRVAPNDHDTIYLMGRSLRRSTDGGKTFTIIKGSPGGDDYHEVWINPAHPERMIAGVDQGATLTVNGGESWSSWYNQPTGQFYHVEADNAFPYRIYSGQQDSGTVAIRNRSDYGAITFRDWYAVGADERDYDVPDPRDPNIVYGSGLGGNLNRFDACTGQSQDISPWPVSTYGERPTRVKNRYTWFTPIAIRHQPPYTLYVGAQHLFASTDQGQHWQQISPDLTGTNDKAQGCKQEHVPIPRASICGYGVIYAIAPSPVDGNEIWIGTDNGHVQLTRDNGKHWQDVTPRAVRDWSKIASVDASRLDAGTAYIAVDRHRLADFSPYVYRTHDYGQHWTKITTGLPTDNYVNVVRADPKQKGLLYAGTNAGAYVSFDDGAHWQSLTLNLPATSVRDLTVHAGDLIAATMGRALWVLDDVTPLRQLAAGDVHGDYLFKPATAIRVRRDENHDTPLPPEEPAGKNPRAGAIIDYYLPHDAQGPVTLAIYNADGRVVRRYASNAPPPQLNAFRYFPKSWVAPPPRPGTDAGHHRFVWDLRYPHPKAIRFGYTIAAIAGERTPIVPQGALVLPGRYTVKLTVDGHTYTQPLTVKMDPRVHVTDHALQKQFALETQVSDALAKDYAAYQQVRSLRAQLAKRQQAAGEHSPLADQIDKLDAGAKNLLDNPADRQGLRAINDSLASFYDRIGSADRTPTQPQYKAVDLYLHYLDEALAKWKQLQSNALAQLNDNLQHSGQQPISDLSIPAPHHAPPMPKDID